MKFADLAKQPGAETVSAEPATVKFADLAKHPDAELITQPAPTLRDEQFGPPTDPVTHDPDVVSTFLAHGLDMSTFGNAERIASAIPLGPKGHLKAQMERDLVEGRKENPWSAALGDLTGFAAGMGREAIPGILGVAGKAATAARALPYVGRVAGPVVGTLARGLGMGAFGGLAGGATALGHGASPSEALNTAGQSAALSGVAGVAPLATGAGLLVNAARSDDPQEVADSTVSGLGLAVPGLVAKLGGPGRLLAKTGDTARANILQSLLKEMLPEAVKNATESNKVAETNFTNRFKEAQGGKSLVSRSPVRQAELANKRTLNAAEAEANSNVAEQNKITKDTLVNNFKEAQRTKSLLSRSPIRQAQLADEARLNAAEAEANSNVSEQNKQSLQEIIDRSRLLKKSVSPVGGGPKQTPSIPGQPDLEAQALGKLGAKAQESYRYLRSKDALNLNLTPEAQAGVQALLPDYEAGANESLAQFAGGKDAVLQSILAELRAQPNQSPASAPAAAESPYFLRPDLLPTTGTLKPDPAAGFVPKAAPSRAELAKALGISVPPQSTPLPWDLGFNRAFAGIKPNPLAGFTPESPPSRAELAKALGITIPPESTPLPRDLGFNRAFAGIKVDPLAGFTPPEAIPTAETLTPKLAPQVEARLAQMRADRGAAARLGIGAYKGMSNPLGAGLVAGGLASAKPGVMAGGALTGAGKALLTDPVLMTSLVEPVGKALASSASLAQRVSGFLAGTTGPLLTAKIQYLMKTDPEFKQAVEAQSGK